MSFKEAHKLKKILKKSIPKNEVSNQVSNEVSNQVSNKVEIKYIVIDNEEDKLKIQELTSRLFNLELESSGNNGTLKKLMDYRRQNLEMQEKYEKLKQEYEDLSLEKDKEGNIDIVKTIQDSTTILKRVNDNMKEIEKQERKSIAKKKESSMNFLKSTRSSVAKQNEKK